MPEAPSDFSAAAVMTAAAVYPIIMQATPGPTPPAAAAHRPFVQAYFHGTKADLKIGDLITVGNPSNYHENETAAYTYFTATLDAAIWGAELAAGQGPERIYVVEPTGPIEDDPNLTNKRFPGNPTLSYRSLHPLRVVGELGVWQGHAPEQLQAMKEGLAKLKAQGLDGIEG